MSFSGVQVLTDSSALDLVTLQVLKSARSFFNSVVLHETIRRLERDLRKSTEPVENVKNVPLGHLVTRKIT